MWQKKKRKRTFGSRSGPSSRDLLLLRNLIGRENLTMRPSLHGAVACNIARKMIFYAILFAFVFPSVRASFVRVDQGALNGKILKSRNGLEFYAFYGIPYAQPPIGQLRFQPPRLPPPSWSGTKDASKEPPFCPQIQMDPSFKTGYFGSENCLYLQVFTRNLTPVDNGVRPNMPVLVFFHGGFFKNGGSALYGAQFFMDEPIVVVTVNSRLGVLGFLSTGETFNSGNYGLKDQTAALLWIRKNIRCFGGDPAAVTIMGQSSGGACAHFHTLSPLSKNLFHRAILHSGTAVNAWSFLPTDTAKRVFHSFKQHANCSKVSTRESVACLKGLPTRKLVELESTFLEIQSRPNIFKPVIERADSTAAFLTTNPNEFAYVAPQTPVILGFNSYEWGPRADSKAMAIDQRKLDVEIPKKLQYETRGNPELARNITNQIKQLYFVRSTSDSDPMTIASNDLRIKLGVLNSIQTYPGPKFAFEYDFRDSPSALGAGHGEELKLLFPAGSNSEMNEEQRKVSKTMIKYWSNFVLTGDPNLPYAKLPTRWTSVKNDTKISLLHISNDRFQMESEFVPQDLLKLWADYRRVKSYADSLIV